MTLKFKPNDTKMTSLIKFIWVVNITYKDLDDNFYQYKKKQF